MLSCFLKPRKVQQDLSQADQWLATADENTPELQTDYTQFACVCVFTQLIRHTLPLIRGSDEPRASKVKDVFLLYTKPYISPCPTVFFRNKTNRTSYVAATWHLLFFRLLSPSSILCKPRNTPGWGCLRTVVPSSTTEYHFRTRFPAVQKQ